MMEFFTAWWEYGFMRNAFLAVLIITPLFGLLGTMIVNNKMAFFSDALGHSALTGIAIGVVLGVSDTSLSMIIFAVIFALLLNKISQKSASSTDTIISVFSSCSIAVGLAILSKGGNFSRYSSLLVGDILSITVGEILSLLVIFAATLAFWFAAFNKLNAVCLNGTLAKSRGIKVRLIENLFAVFVGFDRHAVDQVGRYPDHQCTADTSGGEQPEYCGKYEGISFFLDSVLRILRDTWTDHFVFYQCGDRTDDRHYCFDHLFCHVFLWKEIRLKNAEGFLPAEKHIYFHVFLREALGRYSSGASRKLPRTMALEPYLCRMESTAASNCFNFSSLRAEEICGAAGFLGLLSVF